MNLAASSPKAPKVSIAIGTKSIEVGSWAYLVDFSVSASEATTPGPRIARLIWLGARVSGQVKSQAKHRPSHHGITEIPSGLLLSPWTKPWGSSLDGTSAADKAVLMSPLMAECLAIRPLDFRQLRPCSPCSTFDGGPTNALVWCTDRCTESNCNCYFYILSFDSLIFYDFLTKTAKTNFEFFFQFLIGFHSKIYEILDRVFCIFPITLGKVDPQQWFDH